LITADYHVHSNFSSDGHASMEEMIEEGIRLGLKTLCFTDHLDYDYPPISEYDFLIDPEEYKKKIIRMKELYHSKIEILHGIELGLQPHLSDRCHSLLKQYDFDFIIGSSHLVNQWDPYYPDYWVDKSAKEGIKEYFQSIIENCKAFDGFQVYGHLDYIIRYIPNPPQNMTYDYFDYQDLLDEILKTIIHMGKGIEVNTAGLKYGLPYPHPYPPVLKRYQELGGEIITIGSDAHRPEHLCFRFDVIPEYLKNLGFRYYTKYRKGKPVFEKL